MSFPAYPAYKKSDVEWLGEVPEHWMLSPLKHLALLNPRKSGYDGDTEQLCSFVPMEKLKTGVVQLDEERPIVEVIGGYTYFEDGDVLQAKVTPCFENKNIAIAKGLTNGIGFGSSEINVLRPYQGVNAEYLYYRVQEDSYMDFCTSSMIGAGGLKRVPTDVINNFKVATPEVTEQTQIARFLDHETARIDALIEEQQRLIELLKEKRQAVISHAVTKGLDPMVSMKDSGVEWLGEVPAHWDVSRLKYHSTRIGDGLHSTPEYDDAGDYFFINGNNLVGGAITISPTTRQVNRQEFLKHRVLLDSSTVLISINGTIGNLALYSGEPVILGKSAAYINCTESLSPRFCLYLFSSEQIKRFFESQLTGTTIYNLSLRTIAETPTPLPSIDEQNSIVEFLNRNVDGFDELIDNAMKLAQLLQERRSALISAAVTGKIDVRGWQPPASEPTPELVEEAV